jgi:hydroxymethylbilane synthase
VQSVELRIGTRGSPLALAMASETRRRLAEVHGIPEAAIEVVAIRTTGDMIRDRPLAEAGGKGLFTKELEEALLADQIDLAVHSGKDMPTLVPEGLAIAAWLPREDVRDAFLSRRAKRLEDLPQGAVLGTSSLRRKALALLARPDLRVVEFRGNVETRLRKLDEGVADATLLAAAGLNRLALPHEATGYLEPDAFLPAIAQGAIALEARAGDNRVRDLAGALDDEATAICVTAERAFLAALDGSCRTPIGGLARLVGGGIDFRGIIVRPDGTESHSVERAGILADAADLGRDAGEELLARGGAGFFHAA